MYPNVDLSIQRSHQCKPVLCMAIAAWMLVDLCWCQEQQEGMLAAGEVLRAGATAWTAAGEAPAACHRPPRRCARREAVREAVVQEVRPPGETREEARAAEGPEERREEAPEAAQAGRQAGARAGGPGAGLGAAPEAAPEEVLGGGRHSGVDQGAEEVSPRPQRPPPAQRKAPREPPTHRPRRRPPPPRRRRRRTPPRSPYTFGVYPAGDDPWD